MKRFPLLLTLLVISGCASSNPRLPLASSSPDIPFSGPALPVVIGREVSRGKAGDTRLISEAVRDYLHDSLEEAIASRRVFTVIEAPPRGAANPPDIARITASIISAKRRIVTMELGPFASRQTAFLDVRMEVRLERPGRSDLVFSGHGSVAQTDNAVIVASKQFKDWVFDDSWASVACMQALRQACKALGDQIESERSPLH
jgi:hypothetical protein